MGEEARYERKEQEATKQRSKEAVRQEYAAAGVTFNTPALAQQAAATAAPAQKSAARPRKAPKPEVAQQLAIAASAVPMNGTGKGPGSTVNQPQG